MTKNIQQAHLQFKSLLIEALNRHAIERGKTKKESLDRFFLQDTGEIVCFLMNKDRLSVTYQCRPDIDKRVFNVIVHIDSTDYPNRRIKIPMDTRMLSVYKRYINGVIELADDAIPRLKIGTTHYHSDNLSDFPLDPNQHEDWKRTPNHDLSLLDGVTNIDPALRQLRYNRDKHDSSKPSTKPGCYWGYEPDLEVDEFEGTKYSNLKPVVLQSGKNCEVVIHDSIDAFWNEIRLKEACYILESIQPDSYTSYDLRMVRHYFKHLCSQEMKRLADKLVTVPLIIDGQVTSSVTSVIIK